MTDKDKLRIARLVAEKVWGWREERIKTGDHETTLVWVDDKSLLRWDVVHHGIAWVVFSWPGFGLTVESMESKDMKYEYTMGWTRFYAPNKKPWGSEVKSEVGGMDTYVGFKDEIITACHLAALDALGIDWRADNG